MREVDCSAAAEMVCLITNFCYDVWGLKTVGRNLGLFSRLQALGTRRAPSPISAE